MRMGFLAGIVLLNVMVAKAGDIYVNQVGYLTSMLKYVYTSQQADSFYVVEKGGSNIFFRSNFVFQTSHDPNTGLTIYRGDFTSFTRPGVYFIRSDKGDVSYDFSISDLVFQELTFKSLKGFYFQRCGIDLLPQYAGNYSRAACHLNDGFFHSTTGKSGYWETIGGWHDAGDYGKYVVNAGISAGTLLMAYEYFPNKFDFDNLNIPESGNSVPDILDEVQYELNWLFKMQDAGGGVYFKETRETFEPFEMPNLDTDKRYLYQISSTSTGDFAAVMARAARIYSKFDLNFSNKCLDAAKNAWTYLEQNPSIVPAGGFHNPTGTSTGEYGDGNDSDERLWAAAELFATTGDSVYDKYFLAHYNDQGLFSNEMSWQNVNSMAQLTYLFSNQINADNFIKNNLKICLDNLCSNYLSITNGNSLNVILKPGEFYWGSNSEVLNRAIILIMGYSLNNNINYYNSALAQLNYILGINGNNISYVTGEGTLYPMHPHHRPSASDGIVNPVPGLLVGGPDQFLDDAALQGAYNSSTPPGLCYLDDQNSYASNEIAINWNAPLVFIAGYFNIVKPTKIQKLNYVTPDGFQMYQNYPNPFNPSTTIKFSIPASYSSTSLFTSLKIYDVLGRQIAILVNKELTPGVYKIEFNADGKNKFASGEYFYRLESGGYSTTKKMLYLK